MSKQLNLEEWAAAMLTSTRVTKEQLCAQHGGPYDLQPLVHVVDEDGEGYIATVPDREATWFAVRELTKKAGADLAFIGFNADAYMREFAADTAEADIQRGELARRFGLGDFTVKEQLVVSVIDVKTDEIVTLHQGYVMNDEGLPVFDEPQSVTDHGGGAIKELRKAARRSRR